jgi:hypothetical protein
VATTPPLAEGNALHAVMRRWFRRNLARRARTDPGVIETWLDEELPVAPYDGSDAGSRDAALHRLTGHATWCIGAVPADARVDLAERDLQTGPLRLVPGGDPVRFQARLDLVVEHGDGTVEHIDFKTGSPRATHWIQRAVERVVVGQRHPVGAERPPTRTTTLYAGPRLVETQCHTPESLRATRAELRDLTVRMLASPTRSDPPAPVPAGHCTWCPYRLAGCPAHRPGGQDRPGGPG